MLKAVLVFCQKSAKIMLIFLKSARGLHKNAHFFPFFSNIEYRKIPKISPGAYIFQRPFLRGLFLEGLIFGGAYLRRKFAFQNRLG